MSKLMVRTAAALVALCGPVAAFAVTVPPAAPVVSLAVRQVHADDSARLGVTCMLISIRNGRDMCSASNQTHQGAVR